MLGISYVLLHVLVVICTNAVSKGEKKSVTVRHYFQETAITNPFQHLFLGRNESCSLFSSTVLAIETHITNKSHSTLRSLILTLQF